MFDLPGFWSGWVIALTVVGLLWLAWLLFAVYFGRRAKLAEAAESELVWDGGLREGTAPPPMWWFWLLVAALSFSAVYLVLYPGLGGMRGALAWSQAGQLRASEAADAERHGALREKWRAAGLAELAADPAAMKVARRLFRGNCAACHGEDARGQAKRFPDLTDAAWQWGNDEAQILHTLREGRTGVMPPWGPALGEEGVREVTEYVLALGRGEGGADGEGGTDGTGGSGRMKYAQFCVACHGADGKGVAVLGGPDLTDAGWTYGGSPGDISHSIREGRTGVMPPQKGRLNEEQTRLLAAWLKDGAKGL